MVRIQQCSRINIWTKPRRGNEFVLGHAKQQPPLPFRGAAAVGSVSQAPAVHDPRVFRWSLPISLFFFSLPPPCLLICLSVCLSLSPSLSLSLSLSASLSLSLSSLSLFLPPSLPPSLAPSLSFMLGEKKLEVILAHQVWQWKIYLLQFTGQDLYISCLLPQCVHYSCNGLHNLITETIFICY